MRLTLRTDGGSRGNPGPAGAGVVISNTSGKAIFAAGYFLGRATNNIAEYQGLLKGIIQAKQLGATQLDVFCDSELVVKQVNGQYRVKNAAIKEVYDQVMDGLRELDSYKVTHVYRSSNTQADEMANRAMDAGADVGGKIAKAVGQPEPTTVSFDAQNTDTVANADQHHKHNSHTGKIVVTGGAGFIGSGLIWALNQQGIDNIIVVDAIDTSESWKNLANLQFDDYIDKYDFLTALASPSFSDTVAGILHMGACSSTTEADITFLMKNNFEYTKRLASWCVSQNKRFVYASSAATYGDGTKGFSDDHKLLNTFKPLNGYAFSKWLFDLWALRRGMLDKIAGLKYFNVFGPNEYHKENMRSVVHKAFGQILETGKVKLFKSHRDDYKDGLQSRDFVYVKDVVAATLAIYQNNNANGIFNTGTGKARSFYDLVTATFIAMDRKPNIEFIDMPESIREKYQYHTCAETAKLQKAAPTKIHSLEDAVTDYVKNYLLTNQPHLA